MTDTALRVALSEAVAEALEKMFFVPEVGELDPDAPAGAAMTVQVAFRGDPPGRMTLELTDSSARTIAADFLGEDEADLADDRVQEVVCELANMICGAVLSRLDSSEDFHLGTPQVLSSEATGACSRGVSHGVDIGGGTLKVAMEMESQACSLDEKSAS